MILLYKNSPWGRRVKWFLFQRPMVLGPGYNALGFSSSVCAPSAGTVVTRCSGQRSPLQVTFQWQEIQKSRNARRRRGGDGIKKHDIFPLFLCPPECYFQSVFSYLSLTHCQVSDSKSDLERSVFASRAQGWDTFLSQRASHILGTLIEVPVNGKDSYQFGWS